MITEYDVLEALSNGGWQDPDEISPSSEWDDRWNVRSILEMLEKTGFVETLCSDGHNKYHISTLGQYRLQLLREQRACELRADKKADEQRRIDSVRFWLTFAVSFLGMLAAIGSLIATIVLS